MNIVINPALSRRRFIVSTATAAGGLMLGFHLPTGGARADEIAVQPWMSPLDGGAEINAWLLIDPDDDRASRLPPFRLLRHRVPTGRRAERTESRSGESQPREALDQPAAVDAGFLRR